MFVSEGIKAVRMDDIARRAGISKRTLYESFGDKDELIYRAMNHYFHRMEMASREVAATAPNILIAVLVTLRFDIEHSDVSWRLVNTLKRFHPEIFTRLFNERSQRRHNEFRSGLEEGVRQGVLDPRAHLDLAITMLYNIATSLITPENPEHAESLPEGVTPQEALYEMTIYFLRGIATTEGVRTIDEYINKER